GGAGHSRPAARARGGQRAQRRCAAPAGDPRHVDPPARTDPGGAMIRIGNASGFYGDRFAALDEMLTGGELGVLTGDCLAELTMLILARDRQRDPRLGYARTFLRQMESALGLALDKGVRVVVNAGGLNPAGLAAALADLGDRLGLKPRIGYVTGDELPAP